MAWVNLRLWLFSSLCCLTVDSNPVVPEQFAKFDHDGKLSLHAPVSWLNLRGRIGTVCVAGDDRIGKSTLLTLWGRNKLKSTDFTFTAGHTANSHTRGMWSAILPATTTGLDYNLNLCDSQGLKQTSEVEGYRLFSANVLLPSVLVYMVTNVVQNDQLRDLASYAHLMKNARAKGFKETLSPHLIVLIRDDSGLFGENPNYNQSQHLEEKLSGSDFAAEKTLVKQVFATREAWILEHLPKKEAMVLREPGSAISTRSPFHKDNKEGHPWRESGVTALKRVLKELDARSDTLPQGGIELMQWHRDVFETVNSKVDLLGRLSAFSEVLGTMRKRQAVLQEWRLYFQLMFALIALLLAFGGFLGVWLDRVAWGVWLLLSICYLGSSPFITMSLHSFVPSLCLHSVTGTVMMKYVCQELSAPTAAVLLAAVLGIVTYPLLISLATWLLDKLKLPRGKLSNRHAALLLSVAFAGLQLMENVAITEHEDTLGSFTVRMILIVVTVSSGAEWGARSRKNHQAKTGMAIGCNQHTAAVRFPAVQQLTQSEAWVKYFRSHQQSECLWRYRIEATWLNAFVCVQGGALLAWAYVIRPFFDPVLTVGAIVNMLYLLWQGGASLCSCCVRKARDPVDAWLEDLADDSEAEEEEQSAEQSPNCLSEDEDEKQMRISIEAMRKRGEVSVRSGMPYVGLGFLVVVVSLAYEFANRR